MANGTDKRKAEAVVLGSGERLGRGAVDGERGSDSGRTSEEGNGRLGGERERERGERREWREAGLDGEEEVEVSSAKAGRAPGRHTASSPLCSATRMLRRVCP